MGLLKWKALAVRDADLPVDQVESGDQLGDGMLDLQAGVHLQEIKIARIRFDDKFDRPGVVIIHSLCRGDRGFSHFFTQLRSQQWGRGFLDDLLMPPLHRAFALEEVDEVSLLVAEDLELHVMGVGHILLDQQPVIAEGMQRLPSCGLDLLGQIVRLPYHPHPLAAASGRGFDQNRISDPLRSLFKIPFVLYPLHPRDGRHPRFLHADLRLGLVAHQADRLGGRPDKDQARQPHFPCEGGRLGEKPITRVDGICFGLKRSLYQDIRIQIGFPRRGRTNADRLVCVLYVKRIPIRLRIYGNGLNAELFAGSHDAYGDLAAVGNQDLIDHFA